MEPQKDKKYILAPGTQVREEAFGLLFYTMAGPRLYFMSSGNLINSDFFQGALTLDQWIGQRFGQNSVAKAQISELRTSLNRLKEKGVILEC
jgi:putative mycofactocin binding protein MftB